MQFLLNEIAAAAQAGFQVLAVHGAMSIPDMCSALELDEPMKSNTGDRYAKWFDRYMGPLYKGILTGKDVWYLRCKMQHQGSMVHPDHTGRILFTQRYHRSVSENNGGVIGREVMLIPSAFVGELLDGAAVWMSQKAGDADVQRRMLGLMQFYPTGVSLQVHAPVLA